MAKLIVTLALGMLGVAGSAAEPEVKLPSNECARKLQILLPKLARSPI